MNLFSTALSVGGAGLGLFILGIVLWILFGSAEKAHRRGLDRPMNLRFSEEFYIFISNPDVTLPAFLIFVGILIGFVSIVLAFASFFVK